MISDRGKGLHHLTLIGQCILITASFWGWFLLCQLDSPDTGATVERYLMYNQFILLGLILGSGFSRVGAGITRPNFEIASQRAARQLATMLFYWLLCLVALKDVGVSRAFLFSFIPLAYIILVVSSRYLPVLLGRCTFQRNSRERALVLGPTAKVEKVRRWLEKNRHLGVEIVATQAFSESADGRSAEAMARALERLDETISKHQITKLVLAEFPVADVPLRDYADLCERKAVRLLTVTDIDERFGRPVVLFEEDGLCFVGLREEPLEDPLNRFFKRCLDIAVALPVVVFVLPPLIAVVWVLQRFQSPGPVFFLQEREGLHNRPFKIFKLRTMHVTDPANVRLPASTDDPRLYPLGSLLRKTSLDEMPQFWNVLRGNMSVVGPRPHLLSYNRQYQQVYFRAYVRSFVKPGITGLAQVRGLRGAAETPEDVVHRMQADITYLETWSFTKDLWLILRTALLVIVPPRTAV